jgi:hypothetical protein
MLWSKFVNSALRREARELLNFTLRGFALLLFFVENFVALFAMIIAPPHSATMEIAGFQKLLGLVFAVLGASIALLGRSFTVLFAFAVVQLVAFLIFATWLDYWR